MNININVAFCRRILTLAHDRVRETFPGVKVANRDVIGVTGPTCGQYFVELRVPGFPDFDEYYSADNAFEAKAKAWNAFCDKHEPKKGTETMTTQIITFRPGATIKYEVDLDPTGDMHIVRVQKHRRSNYNAEPMLYHQKIKPGSQNWKRAVRIAREAKAAQ